MTVDQRHEHLNKFKRPLKPTKAFYNKFNKTIYYHNVAWPIL